MKIVKPSVEFVWMTPNPLQTIERAGRTAYKSEDKITEGSAVKFIQMILNRGHESVIEHASMSYRVVTDRGIMQEITRHRLYAFTVESSRWCNYGGKDIKFIEPQFSKYVEEAEAFRRWAQACHLAESTYKDLLQHGCLPEIARSVLPMSLATELVMTTNFREWRHFFRLRTSPAAHPQMQEVANMILNDASTRVPIVFDEFKK